ncbi:hypothetical protein ACH4RA_18880 [Streptomyces smyrnaeus]|uniref:hypothetical protein n=1 Tax=Streptomyces smyrnaeus TaxID=1387713 RepID=UPI0037B0CEC6
MARDTRLVQTAVIGDEHSDVPVVLPTEPIGLDVFRSRHAHDSFWCGLLLGGCGAQLAHKLYVDRQCHFQHYPQPGGAPHACRRPRVGESSADHLYVKSALSQSLLEHERPGRFAFPPPIGSLLDVDLEDGKRLRVHLDEAVPPDWAGDHTIVLGPGVVPEPGVFSRCPYVYRVRCESEGTSRKVWIGTQSPARVTDWVPLSDCTWTDEGLLTPAAARILRDRSPSPGHTAAPAEGGPWTVPQRVLRFVRVLEKEQRSGSVEHVRQLCTGSGPFLESLDPPARAEAQHALEQARIWLAGHEDYQQRVFTELDKAVSEKRAFDVRAQIQKAAALTRHGANALEQDVLTRARAFLREQNHLLHADGGRAPRDRRLLLPPSTSRTGQPGRKSKRPAPTRKPRKTASEPDRDRFERQARRAAVVEARRLLPLLRRPGVSATEQRKLLAELDTAIQVAGDLLSNNERREARRRIKEFRTPRKPARADQPHHRRLPPHVLENAAAAVRGALKKTAREQTISSWERLERQLGSALPHMHLDDRIQVLTLVDKTTPSDQALLSCLVAAGDPELTTAYRTIADQLGLDAPADDEDLRDVLEADVDQIHAYWRHR